MRWRVSLLTKEYMLIRKSTPYGWSAAIEVAPAIAVPMLNAGTAQAVVEEKRETAMDGIMNAFENAGKFLRII